MQQNIKAKEKQFIANIEGVSRADIAVPVFA